MIQPELKFDDPRKVNRAKPKKRTLRKHQRAPMDMTLPQVKWAALKHTSWLATLRTNAAMDGK